MADLHTNIECLTNACKNPRAQLDKYLAAGKKVIGCFEPYTPEELVHASGMIPMGLWGGHTELNARKELSPCICLPDHAGKPWNLASTALIKESAVLLSRRSAIHSAA